MNFGSLRRPDPAVLRLIIFAGSLLATITLLIVFRKIFFPLILGLGIAYLFDPAVSWFERKGRSRVLGVIVVTIVLLLAIAGLVLYLVPAIKGQIQDLGQKFPQYAERVANIIMPWIEQFQAEAHLDEDDLKEKAFGWLEANMSQVLLSLGTFLRGILTLLVNVFVALLNLIFVPVFAFYLLVDFPKLKQALRELVPIPYRSLVFSRLHEVDQAISSFLRGQLVIALILATINATGLLLLQVPVGLVIGIVAGLANMIPYMALVVGLAPALALSWAEHQSLGNLIGVAAVFTGAQMLEGTVLGPRILGKSVNLHPVWVLLAIIVGGSFFGFFGMLLAVPVAASIQVFARHWLRSYRTSNIFLGTTPAELKGDMHGAAVAAAMARERRPKELPPPAS